MALIRKGNREVGALSYGWLLPWDPDPTGARMALLRRALLERPHIKALFWDQATLYQPPRTQDENDKFVSALNVMMDLYASAIGTTCAATLRHRPPLTYSILRVNSARLAECFRSKTSHPDRNALTDCFAWEAFQLVPTRPRSSRRLRDSARSKATWQMNSRLCHTGSSSSCTRQLNR